MKQFRLKLNRLKFLISASIIICQGCILLNLQACVSTQREYLKIQTRATDDAISKSLSLQELNTICVNVNLPDGFTFVSKGGIDDEKLSLAYHYYSDLPFDETRKIFESYFAEKEWSENDLSHRYPKQLDFTDGKYRIAINYSGTKGLSNYSIYCEKLNH